MCKAEFETRIMFAKESHSNKLQTQNQVNRVDNAYVNLHIDFTLAVYTGNHVAKLQIKVSTAYWS